MSFLDWVKVAGAMVGVLWWGWLLYNRKAGQENQPSLAGYLGAAMALPLLIVVSGYGALLLLWGVCWLGLIPASQAIAICY